MPPQILPTRQELGEVWKRIKPLDSFLVEGLSHFYHTVKGMRAEPPSFRQGAELGFAWQDRDLAVVAWTSYVPSLRAARRHDRGWVVIEQAGDPVYFLPINRTKNFLRTLEMEFRIARYRIIHRPECPLCGERMVIVQGRGLGARYWRCPSAHMRADWDTDPFLLALPAAAKSHLLRRRSARERWQEHCRKAGKPIRQAMLRRRKWRRVPLARGAF